MTLRPPSTSPSSSPAPGGANAMNGNQKASSRASLGPSARPAPINLVNNPPLSPQPGSRAGRPTSELLLGGPGTGNMFQTPESEAIDQWFENLQNYEATLEEMAAASLDMNFKEELSAIEQWFRVLSEAERTAALYSLLQHSTQVQIRFFITVLQQMARADPMTALLSPNMGGSMQNQMEAKLAQMGLKSPALPKTAGMPPGSPSARTFGSSGNALHRQSLAVLETSNSGSSFLSPESAANASRDSLNGSANDAAATLAQQRARLKANAAHRISAPPVSGAGDRSGMVWGSQLGQVAERTDSSSNGRDGESANGSPNMSQEHSMPTSISGNMAASRPKSTDFSGLLRSPRLSADVVIDGEPNNELTIKPSVGAGNAGSMLSPMVGGSWASMSNTPMVPLFSNTSTKDREEAGLDAAAAKLNNWQMNGNTGGRFSLDDAKKFRRPAKASPGSGNGGMDNNNVIYGDDGNMVARGRTGSAGNTNWGTSPNAQGAMRSPALSAVSSGRFGSDAGDSSFNSNGGMSPNMLAMQMQQQMNMLAQMQGMQGMNSMNGMSPLAGMNMGGMQGMGNMMEQAQLLAQAQMFMQPGLAGNMAGPMGMGGLGVGGMGGMMNGVPGGAGAGAGQRGGMRSTSGAGRPMGSGRSNNGRDGSSAGGGGSVKPGSGGAGDKGADDDVDPKLLEDLPAWFRKLRLHKYTHLFDGSNGQEKMHWRELVVMSEEELEKKGVAALGARRKMGKTFEVVRARMGVEMPPGKKPVSTGEAESEA